MYASNPKSRIARELLYILSAMREHYIALMRLNEDTAIRFSKLIVLLTIYMIREEGMNKFQPAIIAEHTKGVIPRSSVYKYIKQLFDEGILEEEYGDYTCLARTPKFLLNPEELYGKPLTKVKDKDYDLEDKIKQIVAEMMVKNAPIPQQMFERPSPTGRTFEQTPIDTGRLTQQEEYKTPSTTVKEIQKAVAKKKKKKKEDVLLPEDEESEEPNEVEEELGSFFM